MARIVITTLGSSGDLHPFIALALGLRGRGHDVRFAVEDGFRPDLEALGFAAHRLSGDAEAQLAPYSRQLFGASTPFPSLRVIVREYIVPNLGLRIGELRAACEGADLLISSSLQVAASAVAELTGIRWVTTPLSPGTVPSAHLEPYPLPDRVPHSVRETVNTYSWSVGNALIRRVADGPVNEVRARYGLPPKRDVLTSGSLSPLLNAVACSPAYVPPQPDWPEHSRSTGFLFWDTPEGWREPPELRAFLSAPSPVVAVSSGSMSPSVSARYFGPFYMKSAEAILGVGARALVIGAAPGILPDPLPAGMLAVPYAPFSRVYPACAAVIHHGGIGTVAQGLRAGVPALVVPWGADQFFNGGRVARIGAGVWMPRRSLSVTRAARALDALLREPKYRECAQAIATEIAREDGVATLCAELEGVLAR